MKMTGPQLRDEFRQLNFSTLILADNDYERPDLDWLLNDFWEWHHKRLWNLGLDVYARRNDCDNSARSYAQDCQDCWASTPGDGTEAEAVAVGEFFYQRLDGAYHAIVVAFTDNGKVFIEPQNGRQVTISIAEEMSCFHARF